MLFTTCCAPVGAFFNGDAKTLQDAYRKVGILPEKHNAPRRMLPAPAVSAAPEPATAAAPPAVQAAQEPVIEREPIVNMEALAASQRLASAPPDAAHGVAESEEWLASDDGKAWLQRRIDAKIIKEWVAATPDGSDWLRQHNAGLLASAGRPAPHGPLTVAQFRKELAALDARLPKDMSRQEHEKVAEAYIGMYAPHKTAAATAPEHRLHVHKAA